MKFYKKNKKKKQKKKKKTKKKFLNTEGKYAGSNNYATIILAVSLSYPKNAR